MTSPNVLLVINEQHTLLPEQEDLLKKEYGAWEEFKVSSEGETIDALRARMAKEEATRDEVNWVFVSPIPGMLARAVRDVTASHYVQTKVDSVSWFENDKREKKELPGGKVISTVAKTGWRLKVFESPCRERRRRAR